MAQGGDWGGLIAEAMAAQTPPGLLGVHANFPGTVPPDVEMAIQVGSPPPESLSADERRGLRATTGRGQAEGLCIGDGTRQQTMSGLADSPLGLATWMLDHDAGSEEQFARAIVEGRPYGAITRDDVIDNITLYWLTNTGVSSARLYWRTSSASSGSRTSLSRSPSASSPVSATRRRRAGLNWPTKSSSTSTSLMREGTSPPGSSRSSSQKRFAPASGRFARCS